MNPDITGWACAELVEHTRHHTSMGHRTAIGLKDKAGCAPENVVMLFTRSMGIDRCQEAARSVGADRCHEDCALDGSRSLSRGLRARWEQIVVMRAARSIGADRCHEGCALDWSRSLS